MKLSTVKLLAALLCAALFVLPLLSMGVVALHGAHNHDDGRGEDCVLCACVQAAQRVLRLAGTLLPWLLVALGTASACAALMRGDGRTFMPCSPVRMRVRLNR